MAYTMTAKEIVDKLVDIATNYKTCYGKGMWGRYVNESAIKAMSKYYGSWYAKYPGHFEAMYNKDYWAFDCCCLIKTVAAGWCANKKKTLGGAVYPNPSVPDDGTEGMIEKCRDVSTDFSNIVPGELLWKQGHVGLYIGEGKAVECTMSVKRDKNGNIIDIPKDGVLISAVANIGKISGLSSRTWTSHGKLQYIDYDSNINNAKPVETNNKKSNTYTEITVDTTTHIEVNATAIAQIENETTGDTTFSESTTTLEPIINEDVIDEPIVDEPATDEHTINDDDIIDMPEETVVEDNSTITEENNTINITEGKDSTTGKKNIFTIIKSILSFIISIFKKKE